MPKNIDKKNKTSEEIKGHDSAEQSEEKSDNLNIDQVNTEQNSMDGISKPSNPSLYNPNKKKVQHYFFEFLMLFLAVFCGFLAENWREQLQERNRENEFINTIVEDLKSDTLHSGLILSKLKNTSVGIDSVLKELSSPEVVYKSNKLYRLWTKNLDIKSFVSNDRTIQQLKNNGELRLIRNNKVSDGIMKYDQTLKNYYQQSDFMYDALSQQHIYRKFFDFIKLNNNIDSPVPLTEQGKNMLNEAYAHLQLWNAGLLGLISWLENVNNEGKNLLLLIQIEYQQK
jgi:hypothetical protein